MIKFSGGYTAINPNFIISNIPQGSDVDFETNPDDSIYYKGHYVNDEASRLKPGLQKYNLYCVNNSGNMNAGYSFKVTDKVLKISEVE